MEQIIILDGGIGQVLVKNIGNGIRKLTFIKIKVKCQISSFPRMVLVPEKLRMRVQVGLLDFMLIKPV